MATASRPEALEAALAATPGRPRRVDRLADLLRHGGRRRGLRRGRARRRRAARRRPVVGLALRLPPRPAAVRAPAGRRRGADLDAQDRRLAHAVGDAARRADRPHRPRRGRARGPARAQHVALVAADGLARRRAPPARDPRPGAAVAHDRRLGARPRGDRRDDLPRRRRASWSGIPGVAGWDPLRIVIDVRATGCSGYEVAAALRSAYDIHVELATHATMVLVLGLAPAARRRSSRFAHDFATTVRRIERPGAAEALVRASGALVNEVVVPPREAFLGAARRSSRSTPPSGACRPSRSPATRRASRRCCRASGSPPRASPTCASCAGRARACTAPATRPSAPSSCSATPPDLAALARLTVRESASHEQEGQSHATTSARRRGHGDDPDAWGWRARATPPSTGARRRAAQARSRRSATRSRRTARSIVGSEVEPWIDVDPTSAGDADGPNLIGVYQQDRYATGGARGLGTSVSTNGGQSYTTLTAAQLPRFSPVRGQPAL